MATTAIWNITGSLKKLTDYVKNEEKTMSTSNDSFSALSDVIEYAMADDKILKKHHVESSADIKEYFVSGINCSIKNSLNEMNVVKNRFNKTGGNIAYHGYQSFAENEVTPEICHEIGVKMAKKLWGDRFQVIVTTHLDKKHHLHNHFVLNSVSFVDGKKYNDCKATYRHMRDTSDELCREYGLSVIEAPKRGQTKHYAEHKAIAEGKPTWRGLIKNDIDKAIKASMTDRQFFYNLKQMGYEFKIGKDISVRPQGKERFMRLKRNFGDDYSMEEINKRILTQSNARYDNHKKPRAVILPVQKLKHSSRRKLGGLYGLYLHYLYKLGAFPKRKELSEARLNFIFKEELLHLDRIVTETKFMSKHDIRTDDDLSKYHQSILSQKTMLAKEKRRINNRLRYENEPAEIKSMKERKTDISKELKGLRKEDEYCMNIKKRSVTMKTNIEKDKELNRRKEEKDNVQFRGRS